MSAFNKSTVGTQKPSARSKDGVIAFQKDAYQELCDRVLTCFWGQESFYETGKESSSRILALTASVAKEDPVFLAKLAILAREKFNLRSVTQVLTAELSRHHRGDDLIQNVICRVAQRPDDLTEMVAYLINNTAKKVTIKGRTEHKNKRLPNSIKKGIGKAFAKFDEYQLSKYDSSKKEVSLIDLLRLFHPKPETKEMGEMWGRLVKGELKPAETWERALSKAGQGKKDESEKVEAKTEAWEDLIIGKKLGYMAALRNIRNVIEAKVSPLAHSTLQAYLSNEKAVLNSKQLPFRFYSAYNEIEKMTSVDAFAKKGYMKALNEALSYSGSNVTKFVGRSVLAIDQSGSMDATVSDKSDISMKQIAALLGALAPRFCDESITVGFAEGFVVHNVSEKVDRVLDDVKKILSESIGYSTNGWKVFNYLIQHNLVVDRVIFLTDEQMNGANDFRTYAESYRKIAPNCDIVTINMKGNGTTQIDPKNPRNIYMAGWSDKTLEFLAQQQEFKNGIVDMVNAVEI